MNKKHLQNSPHVCLNSVKTRSFIYLLRYEQYTACKRCTKRYVDKFDLTELVLCDLNKIWSCDYPAKYLICNTI